MRTITDIEGKTIFPLSQLLSPESVPGDIVEFDRPLADLLDNVFFTESTLQSIKDGCLGKITLVIDQEIFVALFGEMVQVVIGGEGGISVFEIDVSLESQPGGFIFNFNLVDVSVILRIPSGILRPLKTGTLEPDPQATSFDIELGDVTIRVGTYQPIDVEFVGSPAMPQCMIGDTGIIMTAEGIRWLTPGSDALPPNTPLEYSGLYLEDLEIQLPEGFNDVLPEDVLLQDFFMGSTGFCGKIIGNWQANPQNPFDAFSGDIFGFRFRLTSIGIEFKQNTLISGSLTGYLQVPFFDEPLEIALSLTNDGDFTIGIIDPDGLLILEKENIISIEVSSLEFVKEDSEFLFKLSGNVTPELAGIDWPSFELKSLSISVDGQVKVDGGWIELPELKTLDFHGFKVEISKLGFGNDEVGANSYNWIGFSGGIQIVQGLPLRGGVEGLKVMWGEADSPKLKIGGVYLQFEMPDVLSFDGTAYFIDDEVNGQLVKEFRGGLDVHIIPINFGVNGQFIAGKATDYNYFYIFIDLDLPVGVPLGPPILGLYGLAGLFGHNMTFDYVQAVGTDPMPDLTDATGPWSNKKGAMAFGAGLTVGTLPDVKFLAKAKAIFAILIPGPVLLIEGQAGMLSLGDNYLFKVLAVLDPAAGTFLMNISAEYGFPKTSKDLLNISGSAEAFFSAADPDDWHLYLGQDTPESKQIRADILSFFKARTYLMVDSHGLRMGSWIGYDLDEKYGILRVKLSYWMGGELALSTMPIQAKGSLTLYGNAELSAGPVSLGISVEANVTAEAPKPLAISAYLEVQLKTPLGKPKAKITLSWEKEGTPPYALPLSSSLGIEHRKVSKNWHVGKSKNYNIDDDLLWEGTENTQPIIPPVPLVPPDVMLVLNFDKPVEDLSSGRYNPAPKPANEKVGNYVFKYALEGVTLQYRDIWDEASDDGAWDDYEDFAESQVQTGQNTYSLCGAWQVIPDSTEILNSKLVLNATTPFEITKVLQDNEYWIALLNAYNTDYPCGPVEDEKWTCVDFENRPIRSEYPLFVENGCIFISDFPMNIYQYPANWLGTDKALNASGTFTSLECLRIPLQEATGEIKLKVIDNVILLAGIGANAYLKFTDEYSNTNEIECAIDNTGANIPASIHFPEIFFPNSSYKVIITCVIHDSPDVVFQAFDGELNTLDEAIVNTLNGEIATYELTSTEGPIRSIAILATRLRILEVCYEKYHNTDISDILVVMPEAMEKGEVHFAKNSSGSIYLYNAEDEAIEQVDFNIPWDFPDEDVLPVALAVTNQSFRSFLISGVYGLIRVCGVTVEDQQTYLNNSSLPAHLKTQVEENWGRHSAQILHPNKYYRLQIDTSASRKKNNGDWLVEDFTEYMYFKTGNPPGPLSELQEKTAVEKRYDQEEALKDLSAYVAYTIPAGAAANEPQPFIYRSYDVGIVFNDSYIDQMYHMANLPLKISFLDNNNQPVLDSAGGVLELLNQWGDNPEIATTREEEQYKNILDENGCITAVEVIPESKVEIKGSSRELLLSPQVQYRAQVIAGEFHPIYEFAFLSSRYANFTHHLHAFVDAVWDHFQLQDDPNYAIDTAILQQVLTNTEDEFVKFEQLMMIFSLNPRTLPERVEVLELNDGSQSCGFLFESPEPLDWDRLEVGILYTDNQEAVEVFANVIKIIGGSIATVENATGPDDYNRQWVDLLVLETRDLYGFQIEGLASDAAEEDEYQPYYTFSDSVTYPAGTQIRIYNGIDPGISPDDLEQVHLYVGNQYQRFQPTGEWIRLLDVEGQSFHLRLLHSEEAFELLDVHLIRNEEGSRFFAFVKENGNAHSELNNGIYKMHFGFHRDIGPEHPVLKRFGFSEPEDTFIEFSSPSLLPDKP